ncbi:MAG: ribonuclease P protein component [Sphingomonadales bacterium]
METIQKRRDFKRLTASKRRAVEPGFILQIGARQGQTPEAGIRLGFTASRKVGNAVARNRAKRRLRALARSIMSLEAEPGRDYVLVARRAILGRPYALLEEDLRRALTKAGVKQQP